MKFCVIGQKLKHTLSPAIHGRLGLDYGAVELKDEGELAAFVKRAEYAGYNVTIPYKKAVIPYLDGIDKPSAEVGAVNTVVNVKGKSYGYNTDIGGMTLALERAGIILTDKNVMILGGGGTSATAKCIARQAGAASVVVVSRGGEINYENCYALTDTEVIINTTPVGMYPAQGQSPVDVKLFNKAEGVFDAVYNPLVTKLVADARALGLKADNGLYMLVAQAVLAAGLFTGKAADCYDIEDTVSYIVKRLRNIVLIGMPSSGKSTVAKEIARLTYRGFIDTDLEVEREYNLTVAEIFERYGEVEFRRAEADAVKRAAAGLGLVIATGGGAVLNKDSLAALKDNGYTVWLKRPIDTLSAEGRPLSKSADALKKMAAEREPIYGAAADFALDNLKTPEETAKEIIFNYEKDTCD